MTRSEYESAIAVLIAGVARPVTHATHEVWFEKLRDLDVRDLKRAIHHFLDSSESGFYPAVAQLRRLAGADLKALPESKDRAIVAWESVLRAIRLHGGYQTIEFDDPAITAAIRSCGGWVFLCDLETEELNKFRKPEFVKAYNAYRSTGVRAEVAGALRGILAKDASRDGYDQPPTISVVTGLPADQRIIEARPKRRVPVESAVKKLGAALPAVETT